MAENRQYDHGYKVRAVKFAKEIGQAKVTKELGGQEYHVWLGKSQLTWQSYLDPGAGSQTPQRTMTLNVKLILASRLRSWKT